MSEFTVHDDALSVAQAYHQRTKHRLDGYAAGPDTLDWDAQPDPFRRYLGAPLQSVYHFTVGVPLSDARIATEPPYAHLSTAD